MNAARAFMRRVRPHMRNAWWSAGEYVFYPVLMLVATPLYVRSLGADQFGLMSLVNAVAGVGGVASLGMGAATIKFVSEAAGRNDRAAAASVVRTTLWLALVGNIALGAVLAAAAPWLAAHVFPRMGESPDVIHALLVAALILVLMQIDSVYSCALKGMEHFGMAARLEICFKLLLTAVCIGTALFTRSLLPVLLASAAVMACAIVVKAAATARLVGDGRLLPRVRDHVEWRVILRFGLWNWLSGLGSIVFLYADRLLLGAMTGAAALGHYTVCAQLAQQVHALPAAAMAFLFPLMSRRTQAGDHASLARLRNAGVAVNVVCSVLLGGGLLIAGPWLMRWWMGDAFANEAGDLLAWLTVAFMLLSLNVAPYYLLLGQNHARYVSLVNLCGGIAGMLAAFLLIPMHGALGAAQARIVLGVATLANYRKLYVTRSGPVADGRR